jgi:SAM-dependent methyltransferase
MNHAATRYLESKRSVDDRALSRRVSTQLVGHLPDEPRILEAGCGTGTTVPRLHAWGVESGSYRGVDRDNSVVSFARRVRPAAMGHAGHSVVETDHGFRVEDLAVAFETGDALTAFDDEDDADLFVAQAFADLVPLAEVVRTFESVLRPGGLAYLPITFDGGTVFQPDHPADETVERAYHRAIDNLPGRDVNAGRHLADVLRRRSGDLLAMASSDWIARPRGPGYPAGERYFIRCILEFIEELLTDAASVDGLNEWLATRRKQLSAGALTYVAHQYDLLYRTQTPQSRYRDSRRYRPTRTRISRP